jgi:hypothetical protein
VLVGHRNPKSRRRAEKLYFVGDATKGFGVDERKADVRESGARGKQNVKRPFGDGQQSVHLEPLNDLRDVVEERFRSTKCISDPHLTPTIAGRAGDRSIDR